MFGATGTLFSVVSRAQNDWKVSASHPSVEKRPRSVDGKPVPVADSSAASLQPRCVGSDDGGERQTSDRLKAWTKRESNHQYRLIQSAAMAGHCSTGNNEMCADSTQTDPVAPKEFSTNSVWQTERVN